MRKIGGASTCAEHLRRELERLDLMAPGDREGNLEIQLTDLSEEFEILARRFLKRAPGRIQRAVLGLGALGFMALAERVRVPA